MALVWRSVLLESQAYVQVRSLTLRSIQTLKRVVFRRASVLTRTRCMRQGSACVEDTTLRLGKPCERAVPGFLGWKLEMCVAKL